MKRYWFLNPKAKILAESIRNAPDRWFHDYSEARNTITTSAQDLEIWVGNGWWFCAIYRPCGEKLGLFGRTLVWRAYRRWLRTHGRQALVIESNRSEVNYSAMRDLP